MTEQEWLECTDPDYLIGPLCSEACERKASLFACACCRTLWDLMTDPQSRQAVEAVEQYADGRVDQAAMLAAGSAAHRRRYWNGSNLAGRNTAGLFSEGQYVLFNLRSFQGAIGRHEADPIACFLLRCIIGSMPFRPVSINPAWLTWHDGLLVSIARQMYESRDFTDMPVLADALEEAGCTNADILMHCRQPGEHVRGCWVVDAILGKT